MPWRGTADPYAIWLSEIILQQTRVDQGTPYFNSIYDKYPNVFSLADANEEDVLRLWQGLGYYSRARNLLKCAAVIVEKFDGKFPEDLPSLKNLPGIGPYTAAAIASLAFNKPTPVVDGNVYRVLARVYGVGTDISTHKARKEFEDLSGRLMPKELAGEYNQALMEFGALQCTPANPDCFDCPFKMNCYARENGAVAQLPVKKNKAKQKTVHFHYIVFSRENRIWMKKRPSGGIWQGLYDFYLFESDAPLAPEDIYLEGNLPLTDFSLTFFPAYNHILSHRKINARFYLASLDGCQIIPNMLNNGGSFYDYDEIHELPKSILADKFLKDNLFTKFIN